MVDLRARKKLPCVFIAFLDDSINVLDTTFLGITLSPVDPHTVRSFADLGNWPQVSTDPHR